MDIYLSEKEQIQKIKDWWKQYGTTVLIAVLIFVGASFGWRYWKHYKVNRAAHASVLYTQMFNADVAHKTDNAKLFARHLMQNYKHTPYAGLAALMLAREDIDANDLKAAQENLQWVIDHAGNKSFRQIARVRKARVLLATKQPQKAVQELEKIDDPAYQALVAEVKGDILLSIGNRDEALQQYQKALHDNTKNGINTSILTMKINMLT